MKEEEKNKPAENVNIEQTKPEVKEEAKPEVKDEVKDALPAKISIEGIGEVDIEELKQGYLRQSDYTKKTQEISNQKRELNDAVILHDFFKKNPEVAKLVAEKAPTLVGKFSEEGQKVKELESQLELMRKKTEIAELSKNKDFNLVEVENLMENRGLQNLSDAYKIWKVEKGNVDDTKPAIDEKELIRKLREEILAEINTDTRSIIGAGGGEDIKTKELTDAEKKVARNLKMSETEYLRYKNSK